MGGPRKTWRVWSLALACALVTVLRAPSSRGDEPAPPTPGVAPAGTAAPSPAAAPSGAPIAASQVDLERDKDTASTALVDAPSPPPEAPPPEPYKKTLVVDSTLGALLFLGKFGRTAPAGLWIHTQVGYELFKWLMAFGEGEVAFTDTSGTQEPPNTRAFPLFGFGGGARATVRVTDRVGIYLQGSLGALKADIRKNALEIIGYGKAESLGLYFGGRLGFEWYAVDRHFGLGLNAGLRDATNFKRSIGSDTPLAFDAGGAIRYAF